MKKFFYGMMAATMIFATSCENELEVGAAGEESVVSFTISTPDMGSRAYSDGFTATQLQYAVYEGTTELADLTKSVATNNAETINGSTTVELKLATGKTYNVIFWAAAPNAPYDVNFAEKTMTVDYTDAEMIKSNNESLDAFYAVESITVKGAQTETIQLRRPFAQLNIGTSDYDDAASAGYTPTLSKVVVSNVYKSINLWDGTVKDGGEVTFDYNAIEKDEKFPVNGYKYLAMNYLLVNSKKELVEVTFSYKEEGGAEQARTVGSVPVQRNHRTNIYGQLLTSDVAVNVEIVPEYEREDNNYEPILVYNANEIQKVLDNATEGTTTMWIQEDIKGDVTVLQKEGVNIVINGTTHKWDGTITVNGNARANGAETLTLENINFEASEAKTFIDAPTKINGKYNYSHNVKVDNCTFSSASYNEEIVGIKLLTTYNAVVKNCTATNIHSLAQFQSVDNATVIENVKVVNCKNGISLGNMASATINGAEITASGYGVRLDGEKTREVAVTIANAKINAYIPVNVRKMNDAACKATVKFEGENALVGDSYEIAFCSNEYEYGVDPVAPKGTFTLDGAEGFDAYVGSISSASAFDAAINSNGDVVVEDKIESVGTGFNVERNVVFDFQDNELNAGSTASSTWYALEIYGDNNVEINNANFTRAGVYADGANVVFNSGVINHNPERSSRYIFCAQNGSTITINDGTFKNDRARNAYFWADNSTIYVKGGNFGGVASNNKVVLTNGGQLIISGGTFNFDPTAWLANGYVATKNGSTWTVSAI